VLFFGQEPILLFFVHPKKDNLHVLFLNSSGCSACSKIQLPVACSKGEISENHIVRLYVFDWKDQMLSTFVSLLQSKMSAPQNNLI